MTDQPNPTERWLMGELFRLSQEVANFAVRMTDADIEKAGPPSSEEEFQLGSRLVELGTVMVARAAERAVQLANKEAEIVESGPAENDK